MAVDRSDVGDAGEARDRSAEDRDQTSEAQDRASAARDERADARDDRAEARETLSGEADPAAVSDRAGARRDRERGASDRDHAEHDREASSADRDDAALDRAMFLVDELTGARSRHAGVLELEREVARATRTGQSYVLAFIDVDGLKATNDSAGHGAGDTLLRQVVTVLRGHVRPYDLIVRYGGDEFLCGLLDVTLEQATDRYASVNLELAAGGASLTAGLALLDTGDRLDDMIKRADEDLYRQRRRRTRPQVQSSLA